jgi:hypothetical protein
MSNGPVNYRFPGLMLLTASTFVIGSADSMHHSEYVNDSQVVIAT